MSDGKGGDLLYGYAEIGEYLGLGERQVKHLAEADDSDFPVFNIGRRRAALKSRLDAWLTRQADKPALDRLADDGGRADE
jgi:hypothetical protein